MERTTRLKSQNLQSWLTVGPIIVYYLILTAIPLYMVFYYSFTDWNGISADWNMIGFGNFRTIFTDSYYYQPIVTTLVMSLMIIGASIVFGLLFALPLSRPYRGIGFFRVIFYLPVVISMAIATQIVNVWLAPVDGTFNLLREAMGLEPIIWNRSVFWMYFWIVLVCVWKNIGGTAILFVAAIQGVPAEVYEAADIDGAGSVRRFLAITLPLLRPMMTFVIITSVTGAFGIFEPVQLISNGGPDNATRVVLFSIYESAFSDSQMGLSNALSVIVLFLTMVLSYFTFRAREKTE